MNSEIERGQNRMHSASRALPLCCSLLAACCCALLPVVLCCLLCSAAADRNTKTERPRWHTNLVHMIPFFGTAVAPYILCIVKSTQQQCSGMDNSPWLALRYTAGVSYALYVCIIHMREYGRYHLRSTSYMVHVYIYVCIIWYLCTGTAVYNNAG